MVEMAGNYKRASLKYYSIKSLPKNIYDTGPWFGEKATSL
jgi:hypothetical protein